MGTRLVVGLLLIGLILCALLRLEGFEPTGHGESDQWGMPVGAGTCLFLAVRKNVLKAGGFNMCPVPSQTTAAVNNNGCRWGVFQQNITTK